MWQLRIFPSVFGALLISVAVFLFMQSLIRLGQEQGIDLVVYRDVQVLRPLPQPKEPEQRQQSPEQPQEEPSLEPLSVPAPTSLRAEPATDLQIPALDVDVGDIDLGPLGDRWSVPLGGEGIVKLNQSAEDGRGFIEVVPYSTRRPNVPDLAWQNKINGWVLVAFLVTREGTTRNVRILDASPRGVFEEKVLAAVEDWRYRVNFSGAVKGDVVLTQKVEVLWKNYPQNLPNVD